VVRGGLWSGGNTPVHAPVEQSLSQHCSRFDSNPTILDSAQTAARAALPAPELAAANAAQMTANQAQNCLIDHGGAFQKYNSTIGFIGFPPSAPLIID